MIVFAFAALYLIWGSTYLAIRYAVETMPPFTMAGVRYLIAGFLLFSWLRFRGEKPGTRREWKSATIAGALLLLGGNAGLCWAEQRIPSGVAALMIGLVPIWLVLLDWARPRGKRPSAAVMVGVAAGFLGLLILVDPRHLTDAQRLDPWGLIVVAACSLSWAVGSLYARQAKLPRSVMMATAMEMISGGVLQALTGGLMGEWGGLELSRISPISWWSFAYLTVFGALVGFSCYVYLLHHTTPAKASTYAFVNPVIAVALGWAVAGEAFTWRTAAATALIVIAVVLIVLFRPRATKKAIAEPAPANPV